jgi:hypothetical protein
MRIALHILLAVSLLFTAASPHSWDDDSGKIAACVGSAPAFREPMENCHEDRMSGSFALSSQLTPPDRSPAGVAATRSAPEETNSTKNNLKIYKLNGAFLI